MSRYYVKVKGGVIVEGPKPIGSSISDSPNTGWSKKQMSIHDMFEVDLSCDEIKEYRDLDNPIITENSVTYPIIKKPTEEYLAELRLKLTNQARSIYESMLLEKYSIVSLVIGSTNKESEVFKDMESLTARFTQIKSELSNLNGDELESYKISFNAI